uniref:Uncharacterized protein n=1 Tax=Dikerogammarus haemobaphes virus 1 TaxID=2704946 RepID=A0A6G9HDR3_9VIRU|nr:hypothetical protein [Dikerogammarus haemobaphes virus 1]
MDLSQETGGGEGVIHRDTLNSDDTDDRERSVENSTITEATPGTLNSEDSNSLWHTSNDGMGIVEQINIKLKNVANMINPPLYVRRIETGFENLNLELGEVEKMLSFLANLNFNCLVTNHVVQVLEDNESNRLRVASIQKEEEEYFKTVTERYEEAKHLFAVHHEEIIRMDYNYATRLSDINRTYDEFIIDAESTAVDTDNFEKDVALLTEARDNIIDTEDSDYEITKQIQNSKYIADLDLVENENWKDFERTMTLNGYQKYLYIYTRDLKEDAAELSVLSVEEHHEGEGGEGEILAPNPPTEEEHREEHHPPTEEEHREERHPPTEEEHREERHPPTEEEHREEEMEEEDNVLDMNDTVDEYNEDTFQDCTTPPPEDLSEAFVNYKKIAMEGERTYTYSDTEIFNVVTYPLETVYKPYTNQFFTSMLQNIKYYAARCSNFALDLEIREFQKNLGERKMTSKTDFSRAILDVLTTFDMGKFYKVNTIYDYRRLNVYENMYGSNETIDYSEGLFLQCLRTYLVVLLNYIRFCPNNWSNLTFLPPPVFIWFDQTIEGSLIPATYIQTFCKIYEHYGFPHLKIDQGLDRYSRKIMLPLYIDTKPVHVRSQIKINVSKQKIYDLDEIENCSLSGTLLSRFITFPADDIDEVRFGPRSSLEYRIESVKNELHNEQLSATDYSSLNQNILINHLDLLKRMSWKRARCTNFFALGKYKPKFYYSKCFLGLCKDNEMLINNMLNDSLNLHMINKIIYITKNIHWGQNHSAAGCVRNFYCRDMVELTKNHYPLMGFKNKSTVENEIHMKTRSSGCHGFLSLYSVYLDLSRYYAHSSMDELD